MEVKLNDKRRLKRIERTYKFMQDLAGELPGYLKRRLIVKYNPYKRIYCRFGRIYVTNGVMLARFDYPEVEKANAGEYSWQTVRLADGRFIFADTDDIKTDDIFERFFIMPTGIHYDVCQKFNPRLIADMMKPFIINEISPIMAQDNCFLEFSGHNGDVSIKTLIIGER